METLIGIYYYDRFWTTNNNDKPLKYLLKSVKILTNSINYKKKNWLKYFLSWCEVSSIVLLFHIYLNVFWNKYIRAHLKSYMVIHSKYTKR